MDTENAARRASHGATSAPSIAVRRFWQQQAPPAGATALVAVSGGADSVCMLSLLHALAAESHVRLQVAHFHHGLRAAAADDAAFVAALADRLGLAATFGAAMVADDAAATGQSLEAAAHARRWAFLEATRQRIGATLIAVGHTADDQAETVLLRLLRGAGLNGLAGLAPRQGHVGRPLLPVQHRDCINWCAAQGVAWREDESNAEPWCRRNALRLEALPFLRRYNPALVTTLAATAETLQVDLAYLESQAADAHRTLIRRDGDGRDHLDLADYRALPEAIRRRVLLRWFGRGIAHTNIVAADALLARGNAGDAIALPGSRQLVRRYADAVLQTHVGAPPPAPVALQAPGVTRAPDWLWRIQAEVGAPPSTQVGERWRADFDAAAVAPPLTLRSRRPGDRMRLPGVAGSKKVQDILVDARVPRRERDRVGVVESANGIAWLVGYRIAAWARPTAATARILRLTVTPDVTAGEHGEDDSG